MLSERYLLQRELGRGGMATVYLARDRQLEREVALKLLRPEVSGALGSGRFTREIAIAARLDHPHILPIHDSGTLEVPGAPPLLYYTMPYVAGRSLRDRLDAESQLPVEEAVAIARQVAQALDHAHRQGIVHRDIKPENILLENGHALVADFGIARALDASGGKRLTETGLALGTPAYMSPEQAAGSAHLDGRADLYALGCVLYEMLAGEPPFTGPTAQAVLVRHALDPVPSLLTVCPTMPPAVARVVMRALAKVPADRFATAGAFADALTAADLTATGPSIPALSHRARARRVLARTGRIGLAVALVAAFGLALALRARRSPVAPVKVDPAVVAVAPFRVAGVNPALGYLRQGAVDLLSTQLGGTLALHPVDSRTMISAWRRAGATGDLTASQALAVAGELGAGQLIQGEVVGSGSRVTISATLLPVPVGGAGARVRVAGPSDSLTSLIDRLAARLLARAAGEPEERLPALAATSTAALRPYLDGWALLRRNRPDAALKKFQEALAGDSTFALAAMGALRARMESSALDRTAPAARLAWRFRDRLTPKDRAFLDVLLGPKYPDASKPAETRAAVDRLTRLDPGNADAWNAYDILNCDLRGVDAAVSERCRAAYRRAVALDSTNALTLYNVADWAADLGDSAFARRALRLYVRQDSLSPGSTMLQWLVATKLGDTVAARRAALSDSMVSTHADGNLGPVWQMLGYYLKEGRGLSDAELVLRRSQAIAATGDQRATLDGIHIRIAVMRGRADGLPTYFDGENSNFERVTDALFADADPAPAVPAAAALERQVGSPVVGGCCLWRFAAAEAALEGGRVGVARLALADMERYARSAEARTPGSGEFRVWPLILRAQLAARERSLTLTEQLRRLDLALVNQHVEWEFGPLYGNLISARLHEARGEYTDALAALHRRDGALFWPIAVTYHREEGRIAAEAGDTASAIRAYQRYLRIRDDVEPRLQPRVRQVRADLAALLDAFAAW